MKANCRLFNCLVLLELLLVFGSHLWDTCRLYCYSKCSSLNWKTME